MIIILCPLRTYRVFHTLALILANLTFLCGQNIIPNKNIEPLAPAERLSTVSSHYMVDIELIEVKDLCSLRLLKISEVLHIH